jgi:signal transduction histidine kinase
VVDDNVAAARMLKLLLTRLGFHQVTTAHDGPSALTVTADFLPDLAFLDIGLPGMDGYELAKCLKGMPGGDTIRLVALTGYGQDEDRRRSLQAGFADHLVKPPSLEDLLRVVQQMPETEGPSPEPRSAAKPTPPVRPSPPTVTSTLATPLPEGRVVEQIATLFRELGHELGNSVHLLRLIRQILDMNADAQTIGEVQQMLDGQFAPFAQLIGLFRRLGETLGPWQAHRELVNAAGWIHEAIEQTQRTHPDAADRLETQVPDRLHQVRIDPRLATILLTELLDNALRYTPAEKKVGLAIKQAKGALVLTVQDRGAGIAPDLLPRLFQPFVRGEGNPDVKSGHLGLGLARVRQAAEAHGGQVLAQSHGIGRGCRMVVTLPNC